MYVNATNMEFLLYKTATFYLPVMAHKFCHCMGYVWALHWNEREENCRNPCNKLYEVCRQKKTLKVENWKLKT